MSPLRYPGGKSALTGFVKDLVKANGLLDAPYVEVYAGGASIAWALLFDEFVSEVHINDINRGLMAFWRAVLEDTEKLCDLIETTPLTIAEWKRQRTIQRIPDTESHLQLGFSTFFLNRTNRSGIIRGGVIGGLRQDSEWRIDARFNRADLVKRVRRIARYSSRIHLYSEDAAVFIRDVLPNIDQGALVYLDPPYYTKSRRLYEDHYDHEDHAAIACLVQQVIRQPWLVSYDAVPQIRKLYQGSNGLSYKLDYTARTRRSGRELIYMSDVLRRPSSLTLFAS